MELDGAEAAAVRVFRERFEAETGVPIRRLAVFGSRARGTWDQDSDIDLLVLVDAATWDLRRRAAGIAADVGAPLGVLLSPKVFAAEEWRRRAAEDLSFAAAAEAEAVDL